MGMPWHISDLMSQRLEFVQLAQQPGVNFRQLCRRFGISARTGYKWLARYRAEGPAGLADRSRRPKQIFRRRISNPRRTDDRGAGAHSQLPDRSTTGHPEYSPLTSNAQVDASHTDRMPRADRRPTTGPPPSLGSSTMDAPLSCQAVPFWSKSSPPGPCSPSLPKISMQGGPPSGPAQPDRVRRPQKRSSPGPPLRHCE